MPGCTPFDVPDIQLYNKDMDVVVDTSAIIAVIANEPERPVILELTAGANLTVPPSIHWEVGNAFSAMFRRRRISLDQAKRAVRSYEQMTFRFIDVDLGQALEISDRLGIYAYDAYVLACALNMRSPLLTLDLRLTDAAPLIGVQVLEIES